MDLNLINDIAILKMKYKSSHKFKETGNKYYHGQRVSEINKTGLPVVKYYKTEESNITKMDFINGITLGDRMQKEKYKNGVEDLIEI